jgi:hypothetical protein
MCAVNPQMKSAPPRASGGAGGTCGNLAPLVGTRDPGPGLFFFIWRDFVCLFWRDFLFGVGSSVSFWRGGVVFVVVSAG